MGVVEDLPVEGRGVVRAQQPPGGGIGEGEVHEPFVPLGLDELGFAAPGPDVLADASNRRALREMLRHEVMPGRDDASGVAAEPRHVGEVDGAGLPVQLFLDQLGLEWADGHENRLARGHRVADEGNGARKELLVAAVEQRLVTELSAIPAGCPRTCREARFLPRYPGYPIRAVFSPQLGPAAEAATAPRAT